MYFRCNDEIGRYMGLDIDRDKDIVKLNRHEVDNVCRENIAAYLRDMVLKQEYRFNKGIYIGPDETFKVVMTDENVDWNGIDTLCIGDLEFKRKRFKSVYNDVHMFTVVKNGEDSYCLKEGDRYLSGEESYHVADLIHDSGNITFSVDVDAWIKIQKG